MEWGIYILALIANGVGGYHLSRFLFKKLLGEVFYAVGENGKRYRVLKRPNETCGNALGRLKQKMNSDKHRDIKWGILFRWQSFWIGAHWSDYNKRLCVNLIPFFTIWFTPQGGGST